MTDKMNEFKYWRIAAWNGPLFMFIFMVFWGGFCFNFPPIAASSSADTIAAFFRNNATYIRLGSEICMTFVICYVIWGIAIGRVMGKIVGKDSVLIDMQVWGAGMTVVPILVSLLFWLSAAYRPSLPATQLQGLLDNAWMIMDMAYATTTVQMIAMGVAFLSDKREKPLVPRWLAWYGIWVGISFVLELLMPFFNDGAFARQGFVNYWIEFGAWFIWCPLLSAYVIKAIPRLEKEARAEVHITVSQSQSHLSGSV